MQPTELNASAASALATAPAVLELAESSRWRAPEVTAALAEQAVRLAGASGDQGYALRAEGWLAHGLVAIGRGVAAVPRAVRALSQASNGHDLEAAGRLRVALAAVARALGDRDTALALLAPVLEYADASLGLRADAHLEAARRGGAESPDGALESVGVAAGALRQLGGEYAELGLAAVDAVLARQERERGHVNGAMERAREGLRRVMGGGSGDGALDPVSPYLAAELSLELMLALLDGGQIEAVRELARSALRWGARPGVLVPVARLRLTLAQRLYLPAGEEDAALSSAEWVSKAVESHDLPEIEVECHGLLAEVLERRGELPFALAASRRAHEAYRLHTARVEQALVLLARSGSEAKLAEARRHPGRARPEAGAGPSSQVAEAITQINFLDGGVRRTGRPGGCESSLPRRPNPLDSDTRPSRQVPPPPGSLQLDPHRSEGNQPRSAYPPPPASEAGTPSRFASPNPPDAGGRPTARPFEGEPSGRRLPAVPPLLGTSWRRTPGADPRQPTTTSIEARRQPGPERGRPTDDERARDGDGEFGRSPDGEGGWPSDRAPSEPTGPGFGARARSERGPRRPDERPGQPWTTSRGPGNPVSESTFGMRRVPAPGEAVRGGLDDPGGVEGPPVFPGRTEGGIPAVGGGSGATFGEPGRAPRCRDVAGAEALVVGPEPGQPRPGADPETGPGMPGHAHDRPPPMGRDGGGDLRLGRPNEPARRGGPVRGPAAERPGEGGRRRADETWSAAGYGEDQPAGPGPADGRWSGGSLGERPRLVANEPGRVGADRGEGGWFGGVEPGADEDEGLWPGGGSDAGLGEAREPGLRARPGDAHEGGRRALEAADWAALSIPELAVKLAQLAGATGQSPHLVLVDIVSPEGSGTGAEVAALAGRIGELVRDQLPEAARLYPLDGDAMAIGMPEADPEVVTRWVRSLSTRLSQRWPELAAELPRAVFRIGVRWLGGVLSVEQHVRELRAGRVGVPSGAPDRTHPTDQPSYPPFQPPGRTGLADLTPTGAYGSVGEPDPDLADVAPPGGRHGAASVDPEPSSLVAATNRVSALPGSGGRRRRAEGAPDDGLAPAMPGHGVGQPAPARFGPAPGAPGDPGGHRSQPASAPSSARWTAPRHGGGGGHAVPDDGGVPANGSRLSGVSMNGHSGNGHTGSLNGHAAPANGHAAPANGQSAPAGVPVPGRTALADPGAPARQRRHRDPLSATGSDHDTRAWRAAGEAEPNGRTNGVRRANGHHIPGDDQREQDVARTPGRHAKPSAEASDASAGAPAAASGGIGATAGVEARTPTAADEWTGDVDARPAGRRAGEDASPPASQDGSGAGRSVSELSFAELLAGALAAYREA